MSDRVPIEVSAALLFHQGRLLITQRPAGSHLAGLWEFPGGKREPGETWEACLARELQEELGIGTEVGRAFEDIVHAYPDKTVHLRFFLARWTSGELTALGCAAFRWVDREGLADFDFPPADRVLLGRIRTAPDLWV